MREVSCLQCEKSFKPSYVYQVAVSEEGRRYFCSLSCRKRTLGDEGFRARRARRIAVLNQKGGTGKTTTALNLAAGLAERGQEVLLLDTDAQGNVGASLGIRGAQTLYHILVDGAEPTEVAIPVRKGLDVVTSDASLAIAELALAHKEPELRPRLLAQRLNLAKVTRHYAYVLLDCGPSLSLMNQNALYYADEVLIPVTCDYLALVGVKQVLRTLKDIERHLGHSVRIGAVLPTFYDGRVKLAREAYATLRDHFKDRCLAPVRQNTKLAEAPAHKRTIFEHAPDSHGAEDYNRVVEWMLGDAVASRAEIPAAAAVP